MRILWVCNTVLPVVARQIGMPEGNKEGWLSGLVDVLLSKSASEKAGADEIELAVAFPVEDCSVVADAGMRRVSEKEKPAESPENYKVLCTIVPVKNGSIEAYIFAEDINHAEEYSEEKAKNLSAQLLAIAEDFKPDVIHCYGTEYPHTCAICEAYPNKERLLISIQGLCAVYAESYMASMPEYVVNRVTFRDWLKKDSLKKQQEKYVKRGEWEIRSVKAAGNVSGRTHWDLKYTKEWNPNTTYYAMNETLREGFYEGSWDPAKAEKHSIFLSQGNYPIKGLHYMLKAMPKVLAAYPDAKVYVSGNRVNQLDTLKDKIKISSYGKYINEIIRNNRLENCVHFLGGLSAPKMKEQYLKSYTFVCCSTIENSPNSLGEAMLLGVPCVTADVGGITSIFTPDVDGIAYAGYGSINENMTVNSGEGNGNEDVILGFGCGNGKTIADSGEGNTEEDRIAEALADAIIKMWSDEKQMVAYGKQASEHARSTHNREANQERLLEIYKQIAGVS